MGERQKFNPDKKSGKESVEDIKRSLAMYHRDVADHYEGTRSLSQGDLDQAEREIKILQKQLEGLEK